MECSPKHISLLDSVVQEILDCGHWLHYGRRLLDEDKSSSSKTNMDLWITITLEVLIPVILLVLDQSGNLKLTILGVIGFVGVMLIVGTIYIHRKRKRFKLSESDKTALNLILPQIELYLTELITFLQKIDIRCPMSEKQISLKFKDFEAMKRKRADLRHQISVAFGKVNSDWEKESAKLASEELRPYMKFYEKEENHE
ncbi:MULTISPECIES: hypothetical protein [Bacteroides]|uniref:hypothetical protein n=1 Tax=Bacteroides TaxID=816 RepID=UPI002573DE57|nr:MULTISPECIES: hypothetical protein [Bacteroides]